MATASVPNTFASAVTATGLQLDQNYNTIVAYINEPLNRNNWATDSGNTNTVVLTFVPPVSAYSAGLEITFKAAFTNTTSVVINANGLGNKNFIQPGGGALAAGQIEANGIYKAAYNGSAFVYIGQNVLAASAADVVTATSAITFVSPSTLPAAAASQANLETATATVGFMTPANAKFHALMPKAWAALNGTATGTITTTVGMGIAHHIRMGTGSYAVGLTSPMASSAYGVFALTGSNAAIVAAIGRATATFTIGVTDSTGSPADSPYLSVLVVGDLP